MHKLKMQQSRVFITGGGSGLGQAIALYFAEKGCRVAIGDINEDGLETTKQMLLNIGSDALALKCDATSLDSLNEAKHQLVSEWQGLDILINNAGIAGKHGFVESTSIEDWQKVIDINLLGVVRGCMVFLDLLKQQKKGAVVNIASMAGLLTPPEGAIYNTSKSAVIALTETLQYELAPFNVSSHAVCPAFFKTNLTRSMESNPKAKRFIEREMDKSSIIAADVAKMIFEQVENRQLLLLTHPRERRLWRLKKLLPSIYEKMAHKLFAKVMTITK